MKTFLVLLLLGWVLMGTSLRPTFAHDNLNPGKTARDIIAKMAGCYQVTYQNAETFSLQEGYQYRDRFKAGGLEWIVVDEQKDNEISLQHLLITPGNVTKHWRQQWLFEHRQLYSFEGDNRWQNRQYSPAQVQGQWTQKVFQVDDGPRYECSAPWLTINGKIFWECETNAPLPRREFSQRQDPQKHG